MPPQAHLTCPSCGASHDTDDDVVKATATGCGTCRALAALRAGAPSAQQVIATSAEPVPLPPQIQVVERGREVTIVHRWFTWAYPVLALFSVVWMSVLVFWYAVALQPDAPLTMRLIPVVHVAVGLGLCYTTVAGFVNRTYITIDRDHLSVRHGPLPWRGNVDLAGHELEQVFCTGKTIRQQRRMQTIYSVEAVLRDGRKLRLVRGLGAREQALFIEQTIERHLGIADRPVQKERVR